MSGHVSSDFVCGSCGKKGWRQKKRARAVVRVMRTNYGADGALRPYRACGGSGYHVGHFDRQPRRPNLNDPRLTFLPST